MTAPSAGWSPAAPARGGAGASPEAAPDQRLLGRLAFGLSVFMLLVYSEFWLSPLLGDKVDDATSGLIRTLYFPAYAASLALLALRPKPVLRVLVREPFLVAMILIVIASITWSVQPEQTQRRVVAIVFTTFGGVVLGARWRWTQLVEVFAVTFGLLAVASLFVGVFVPSIGRMDTLFPGAWRGLWQEKNGFGGLMTFAILFFLPAALLVPRRRLLWLALAGLALGLLLLSQSKTSLVALVLGVGALGLVSLAQRGGAIAVITVYCAVMGAAGLGFALWQAPEVLLGLLGKDATLTGRTQIWAAVMTAIHKRPLLGYGYAAVWGETDPWGGPLAQIVRDAKFKPDHAHNSWLEQWLGMGLLGLTAWSLYFLTALCRAIWAVFTSRGAFVVFPFLLVFTLISLTESEVLIYNDMRWVMFVALLSRLALPQRESE